MLVNMYSRLIPFILLVWSLTLIQTTRLTETTHLWDGKFEHNAQYHEITSDPNYDALVSSHPANPASHPPEAWADVLDELSFGPELKERQATAKAEAQGKRNFDLPAKFDARKNWRKCKRLIGTVYDQGACISDYAIVAASVLADRLCIKYKGKFNSCLSAQKVLGCYGSCQGGYIYPAFSYLNQSGIPTGGLYGQKTGCIPFEPKPCFHVVAPKTRYSSVQNGTVAHLPNCTKVPQKNYTCPNACTNIIYGKKMDKDLHFISAFAWTSTNEAQIREDIMNNGPVGAAFSMYSDFNNYRGGVYTRDPKAKYEYNHKIKLIGWGKEKGRDYWLAVNTFGKRWGKNGLFKIPRGENYLYLETLVMSVEAHY